MQAKSDTILHAGNGGIAFKSYSLPDTIKQCRLKVMVSLSWYRMVSRCNHYDIHGIAAWYRHGIDRSATDNLFRGYARLPAWYRVWPLMVSLDIIMITTSYVSAPTLAIP